MYNDTNLSASTIIALGSTPTAVVYDRFPPSNIVSNTPGVVLYSQNSSLTVLEIICSTVEVLKVTLLDNVLILVTNTFDTLNLLLFEVEVVNATVVTRNPGVIPCNVFTTSVFVPVAAVVTTVAVV